MTCFHPIKVWQLNHRTITDDLNIQKKENKIHFHKLHDGNELEIPCGRCLGCRLDHANMWATRIAVEAQCWKANCFVTLTYNNPHLPRIEEGKNKGKPTLKKRDIQLFLKKLRRHEKGISTWYEEKYNENLEPYTEEIKPIRYFYCGEYGPKGGRPHYHMAIFNWIPDDLKLKKTVTTGGLTYNLYTSKKLQKYWDKGFVIIGMLNYETASYIARYVQKKAGIQPKKRKYWYDEYMNKHIEKTVEDILKPEPEFIQMSTRIGIGKLYWKQNREKIKRNGGILIKIDDKVKNKPIPRYFKKLWEKENYEEYYRYKYTKEKEAKRRKIEILANLKIDGKDELWKWNIYLEQQEKTLIHKAKYLKRNNFQKLE